MGRSGHRRWNFGRSKKKDLRFKANSGQFSQKFRRLGAGSFSEHELGEAFQDSGGLAGWADFTATGTQGFSDSVEDRSWVERASDWEITTRFHEIKNLPQFAVQRRALQEIAIRTILRKAIAVIGRKTHPAESHPEWVPLEQVRGREVDWSKTFSENPTLQGREVVVEEALHDPLGLLLTVDTSLSMNGEKLALTAIAVAVVGLFLPHDAIGLIAFENEARVLKQPFEPVSVPELIRRFLDVPARGYTHLEKALLKNLELQRRLREVQPRLRRLQSLLISDGKYTAGKNPEYLAPRFEGLHVLKMGQDAASSALCQRLAAIGGGESRVCDSEAELPDAMLRFVRELHRGSRMLRKA